MADSSTKGEATPEPPAEKDEEVPDPPRPHDGEKLGDIIRSYANDDGTRPTPPGFEPDSGWKVTVGSFTRAPGSDDTISCPVTGDQIPRSDPHILINLRRDPFPNTPGPTTEHMQFAFRSRDQLREWFESAGMEQ